MGIAAKRHRRRKAGCGGLRLGGGGGRREPAGRKGVAGAMSARDIAERLLGAVAWTGPDVGFCRCPGVDLHTTRDGKRDCRVIVSGAPTIYCLHTSCAGVVAGANRRLRSTMGRAQVGGVWVGALRRRPSAEEIQRRQVEERRQELRRRSAGSIGRIIAENRVGVAELLESSPMSLAGDPRGDWRLLLRLFDPSAVVWIGDTKDSCNGDADEARKAYCRRHFRRVGDWLGERSAPGQFTCPGVFKPGVHSRSNENVASRPFLVVESDTLRREEMAAVFRWMRGFMRLRAVVDTAGKSLHGWFEFPAVGQLEELRVILPAVGCDEALFRPSQPCRLPGAPRGNKVQRLLWLDLEEKS